MNSNRLEEMGADEQRRVNSAVQARIEAMFASVEAESGTPGECAAAILPVNISITFLLVWCFPVLVPATTSLYSRELVGQCCCSSLVTPTMVYRSRKYASFLR